MLWHGAQLDIEISELLTKALSEDQYFVDEPSCHDFDWPRRADSMLMGKRKESVTAYLEEVCKRPGFGFAASKRRYGKLWKKNHEEVDYESEEESGR